MSVDSSDRTSGCEGKFAYDTRQRAMNIALRYSGSKVYRCEKCACFHIGQGVHKSKLFCRGRRAAKRRPKK